MDILKVAAIVAVSTLIAAIIMWMVARVAPFIFHVVAKASKAGSRLIETFRSRK